MIALFRHRTFLACAALLAVSAAFNPAARRELAAQSAPACERRSRRAAGGLQVAQHRPGSRRPLDCGLGRQGTAARGVLRRHRRRALEDDRRRRALGARHRRPDQELVGRRRRRLRIVTRRASSSAWASRASAATSCPATASTSRPTPARRGRTSASRDSDAISKIRIHPDQSRHRLRRRLRHATARTATSAACSRPPTAASRGRGCCSATRRPARPTSRSTGRTRT